MDSFFKLDTYCKRITAGEEIEVWGTNFLAFPIGQFSPEFKRRYAALADAATHLLEGTGLYMYPVHYLHITLGPPALFHLHDPVPFERRAEFEKLWSDAVAKAISEGPWEDPFEVHYGEMKLEQAAAFFLVDDPTGAIGRIRKMLKQVSDDLVKANPGFPSIKIPNIVHTTFLRYMSAPVVSQEEVRARFEQLRAMWKDALPVRCDKLVHMREIRPYMHQDNANQILREYAYQQKKV